MIEELPYSGPRYSWWIRMRCWLAERILPKIVQAHDLRSASPGERAKFDQIFWEKLRETCRRSSEILILARTQAPFVEAEAFRTPAAEEADPWSGHPSTAPWQGRLAEDWLREHRAHQEAR